MSKLDLKWSIIFMMIFMTMHLDLSSQNSVPWFNAESKNLDADIALKNSDCVMVKNGFDESLNVEVVQFKERALFMHTHPQFKKWMKDKFLMECTANIYHADEASYLQMHFKINSENAKHSYGKLEQGAKIKIIFTDNEHVYMENIERDRGKMKRSKKQTLYEGVFPIDKQDRKELKKREIDRIGIIWEEGYQEYDIQNMNLLKNQLTCLDKKK